MPQIVEEEAGTLRAIDALRDDEQHWFTKVTEGLLYLHARAAVTLFDELLSRAFNQRLGRVSSLAWPDDDGVEDDASAVGQGEFVADERVALAHRAVYLRHSSWHKVWSSPSTEKPHDRSTGAGKVSRNRPPRIA